MSLNDQDLVCKEFYHFIDSNAMREYLQKLSYTFTSLEAAYLVFRCRSVTLEEKFEGWKMVIRLLPDCSVKSLKADCRYAESIHRILEEYMDRQRNLIKEFYADDGGIYMTPLHEQCMISAEESVERCRNEVHLVGWPRGEDKFGIEKFYPASGGKKNSIAASFNRDGEILSVREHNRGYPLDPVEYTWIFHDHWFEFPTPFRRGDILVGHWEEVPFVLNYLDTWNQKKMEENGVYKIGYDVTKRKNYLNEKGTTRDMNAVVYRVNEIGKLYQSVLYGYDDYLDLEYYEGDLTGPYETFVLLRDLMAHKLDIAEFLDEYEQILALETCNQLYNMANGNFPDHELDEQVHRDVFNVYQSFLKEQI